MYLYNKGPEVRALQWRMASPGHLICARLSCGYSSTCIAATVAQMAASLQAAVLAHDLLSPSSKNALCAGLRQPVAATGAPSEDATAFLQGLGVIVVRVGAQVGAGSLVAALRCTDRVVLLQLQIKVCKLPP